MDVRLAPTPVQVGTYPIQPRRCRIQNMDIVRIDLNEVLPDGTYLLLPREIPKGLSTGVTFEVSDQDGLIYKAQARDVGAEGALIYVEAGQPVADYHDDWAGVLT